MPKKQAPLKLGDKMKVIPLKKQRRNPRVPSLAEFSMQAVRRAAETLVNLGFSEVDAYRSLAAQLHESLVALKKHQEGK
jgi:hypothetical protein